MKRNDKRAVFSPPLLALLGVLMVFLLTGCEKGGSGDYLLTVDGYGVTEEEFRLFLGDQKAATANYFWTTYQVQPDAAFWTTAVNGETPIDYAKQRALDALIRSKVEFILASERDILQYKDYNALIEGMEIENADRARKLAAGEVVYGLTEFTPFTYFQYLSTNIRAELEHTQRELAAPSENDLRQVYEANRGMFDLGTVYEYEIVYADGSRESVSQHDHEIGKEDTVTEDLIFQFASMAVGDTIADYAYRGRLADVVLLGVTAQGGLPFEDAQETLRALYASGELSNLIQSRVEAARVEIDLPRFDALIMQ